MVLEWSEWGRLWSVLRCMDERDKLWAKSGEKSLNHDATFLIRSSVNCL